MDDVDDLMAALAKLGEQRQAALRAARISPAARDLIVRLDLAGAEVTAIARAAGASRTAIYSILREAHEWK